MLRKGDSSFDDSRSIAGDSRRRGASARRTYCASADHGNHFFRLLWRTFVSATETLAAPRTPQSTAPDFAAIKAKQQATWASGDFAVIGITLQIVGESLAEAVDVRAGERVLDVAAGNGNATLAAARRFADVTSTDYVPALLDKGRARADAEGLKVAFRVADAEALDRKSTRLNSSH